MRLPSETANPDLPSNELLKGLVVYPKKDEFNNNFMKRQVVRLFYFCLYIYTVHTSLKLFSSIYSQLRFMPLFNKYMPFKDKSHPVPCRMSMRNEIRKKIMRGLVSKPTEGEWIAPLSDESMHRVCFYNFGMWFMKKFEKPDEEGNLYFADMTYLSTLRYRRDYEVSCCFMCLAVIEPYCIHIYMLNVLFSFFLRRILGAKSSSTRRLTSPKSKTMMARFTDQGIRCGVGQNKRLDPTV